jgi:predicted extracellular nuclease
VNTIRHIARLAAGLLLLALVLTLGPLAEGPVHAASPNVVISQVYGGGGNSGAPYRNDFIELFNRGTTTVSLSGMSVQYASATGTGNFGGNPIVLPSGSLAPGQYYLVQEASGGTNGALLPTPDAMGSANMSASAGKVALVNSTSGLACNGGSTPCSPAQLALIVDLVGYGTGSSGANFFEGAGQAPTLSNTTADFRASNGCQDIDDNSADFSTGAPAPRNTASPLHICPTGPIPTNPSGIGAAAPSTVPAGSTTLLTVAVTPGENPTSTGLAVNADLSAIGGTASQAFFDDGTNGDATAGDDVFSYTATVSPSTAPGVVTLPATVADAESRTGSASISLTVQPPLVAIHAIQGAGHISPLVGQLVSTQGIVTAKDGRSFYMQDPNPDADEATSEGIYVYYTSSSPTISVGDLVLVTGTVQEYRPGGSSTANLTTTELGSPGRSVTVLSSGNPLPAPTVIGAGGRILPDTIIENDTDGDIETDGNVFDPSQDGIDFYESLEGMLVQVNDAVAVGPTNAYGETPVVGDNGAYAVLRTNRGGVLAQSSDFNPERIILNDTLASTPVVNVGDQFTSSVVGVIDYNFGNFMLEMTSTPTVASGGLTREVTGDPTDYQLSVASFNVENLSPTDPPSKFATLAGLIVNNLKSPDIVGLEEIQDNNGTTDDGMVDANVTLDMLVAAIQTAGGPAYEYRQINPVNDQDGGAPGGNIRVGFLFNPGRVAFVDRPGGTSTDAVGVINGSTGPELTFSPGRIDPNNPAFLDSRKPLAGEFVFKGDKVFVIVNHFNSKSGDTPLFGLYQPPQLVSEIQRLQQAQVVHDFVASILTLDPNANVVVAGDLNDFQFSTPLAVLTSGILTDLVNTLPLPEQYTYVYEGNSEVLDHILASNRLASVPFSYDIVHVNAEFADQASDHEPEVALLCTDRTAPTVNVSVSPDSLWPPNHQYVSVYATVSVSDNADPTPALTVSVTSNEPDNGLGDGDTPNDIVIVDDFTFKLRAERSGTGNGRIYTITYQATDACGNSTQQSATVTVPHDRGKP